MKEACIGGGVKVACIGGEGQGGTLRKEGGPSFASLPLLPPTLAPAPPCAYLSVPRLAPIRLGPRVPVDVGSGGSAGEDVHALDHRALTVKSSLQQAASEERGAQVQGRVGARVQARGTHQGSG